MGGCLDYQQKGMWIAYVWICGRGHDASPIHGRLHRMDEEAFLSAGEVTGILKGFLKCDDDSLSSHSLKATALSWAAKAEGLVTRGEILGWLASSVKDSDSVLPQGLEHWPCQLPPKGHQHGARRDILS